jgi:hypothetical protein
MRADATAVGGYFNEPIKTIIPTVAPVSLPVVGGLTTAQSQGFSVDSLISCGSAYTRVSGRQNAADGSLEILMTAVVERLNILEVVRIERLVAQVAMMIPVDREHTRIALAGSACEGVCLAGRETLIKLNADLQQAGSGEQGVPARGLRAADFRAVGRRQALSLLSGFEQHGQDAHNWVSRRHGWMTAEAPSGRGNVLCSLVDGLEGGGLSYSVGHIAHIPQFGRI